MTTNKIDITRRYGCPMCGSSKFSPTPEGDGYMTCERCEHVFEEVKPLTDAQLMQLVSEHIRHMPKGTSMEGTLLELHMRTIDHGVILWAYRDEAPHPMVTRYCTHQLTLHKDTDCWYVSIYHGHYDMTLADAAEDFQERCAGKWA